MVRRGDDYGCDRFVIEGLSHVVHGPALVNAERFGGRLPAGFVDVAYVGDFDARHVLKELGVVDASPTAADQGDFEHFRGASGGGAPGRNGCRSRDG
jgi:hypothetical protein